MPWCPLCRLWKPWQPQRMDHTPQPLRLQVTVRSSSLLPPFPSPGQAGPADDISSSQAEVKVSVVCQGSGWARSSSDRVGGATKLRQGSAAQPPLELWLSPFHRFGNVLPMDPRDWGRDSYGARPGWRIRARL